MGKRTLSDEERAMAATIKAAVERSTKSQEAIGVEVGVTQGSIWQWMEGKEPVSAKRAPALAAALGIDDPAKISSAYRELRPNRTEDAIAIFTPERRADDNVTAVHIAVESLAVALLRQVPGSAEAFAADLEAICSERHFSPHHALLGRLLGSARTIQSIEAAEDRVRRRAGPARRTKP
ncbi:MAG: hypothetical protein J0I77_17655 [Rudaea sp.]|uniref:helix-turn-helix domain-containing protein n=1 Tax=unclassified Rudaea TaxID=2627037 RepID=UPI0010F76451|nr:MULTISPECIES: helix-turn-helix domain-containing protein [unclassified Rudaea]MBN8887554.1 hypothetical protein [Rudaea sp.]